MSTGVLGVIAGSGVLPLVIADEAKRQGFSTVIIALEPVADMALQARDRVVKVNIGRFGKLLKTLKEEKVEAVVLAGKVPKTLLYQKSILPDTKAIKLLLKLRDRRDDTIMQSIVEEFESEGIRVLKTTEFTAPLMINGGVLTKKHPSTQQWKDIKFGFKIAKEIGRLDIGQTVVIKDRAVMAVEAIEGTDEAIKRGGLLAGSDAVVVKVSKPQQDHRFDVPVVGMQTLQRMVEVKAKVLALEAQEVIVLQKDRLIDTANREGISIVGVSYEDTH